MTFLSGEVMGGGDWRGLELAVARFMAHCGWCDVQDVGNPGDMGADILGIRFDANAGRRKTYLVQVKAVTWGSKAGVPAINQALEAQGHYRTDVVVVATNGEFSRTAIARRDELNQAGNEVILWNGADLRKGLERQEEYPPGKLEPLGAENPDRHQIRPYQDEIVNKILSTYESGIRKAFFVLATGLGKTAIASTAADLLIQRGLNRVLVLCHTMDLARQLQEDFWGQISKTVPTRLFMDGRAPVPIDGINFGLYQTLYGFLGGVDPDAFDLVIVDESHHALANAFAACIEHLTPRFLIGMTATPWRGDGLRPESIFGEPILDPVSLVDGMKMGFLTPVDYRLMSDDLDWTEVQNLVKKSVTVRDLNRRLFVPRRDDAIIDSLVETISEVDSPRVAVFSPTRKHAEWFAQALSTRGIPAKNVSIADKAQRRSVLQQFRAGRLMAITAVDVLNEGIDVPEVNILVFLRATHSRRIFVQQLGRGLRVADTKKKVIVLDFVTDIRRLAAVASLDREAKQPIGPGETQTVHLGQKVVTFSDPRSQRFVDAWLEDVASLEDKDDGETLLFPNLAEVGGG